VKLELSAPRTLTSGDFPELPASVVPTLLPASPLPAATTQQDNAAQQQCHPQQSVVQEPSCNCLQQSVAGQYCSQQSAESSQDDFDALCSVDSTLFEGVHIDRVNTVCDAWDQRQDLEILDWFSADDASQHNDCSEGGDNREREGGQQHTSLGPLAMSDELGTPYAHSISEADFMWD